MLVCQLMPYSSSPAVQYFVFSWLGWGSSPSSRRGASRSTPFAWSCSAPDGEPSQSLFAVVDWRWMFPKIGVTRNRWFIMENPIKMDDLGENHYFRKHPDALLGPWFVVHFLWKFSRYSPGAPDPSGPLRQRDFAVELKYFCWSILRAVSLYQAGKEGS